MICPADLGGCLEDVCRSTGTCAINGDAPVTICQACGNPDDDTGRIRCDCRDDYDDGREEETTR